MKISKCKELFDTIKEYEAYILGLDTSSKLDKDLFGAEDLIDAVRVISGVVYEMMPEKDSEFIKLLSREDMIDISELQTCMRSWTTETGKDIDALNSCFVSLDYNFERMMLTVERCNEDDLVRRLLTILTEFGKQMPSDFESLVTVYSDYAHLWGEFNPATGKYDHFINGIHAVKEHADDIRWLYNAVEDYRSRKVIYGLIMFWLQLDFSNKNTIKENNYDDYFDLDILKDLVTKEEVFVDCGAFTGDTVESYLENFLGYGKMFLYDMIPANLKKAREALAEYEGIVFRNAGVGGPKQEGMKIPVSDNETSVFSFDEKGLIHDPENEASEYSTEVEIVTLDKDIEERITFLKMDVEGFEINALLGAKEHIINDGPKLAICTYHHYEHLWEIPKLIRSMNPAYKLYLRYNGDMNGILASEHFVLAVL